VLAPSDTTGNALEFEHVFLAFHGAEMVDGSISFAIEFAGSRLDVAATK